MARSQRSTTWCSAPHAVFAEYGNVGTEFDYIAGEGFGWMNASFQVGAKRLSAAERAAARAFSRTTLVSGDAHAG